jgi:hypothetical protein
MTITVSRVAPPGAGFGLAAGVVTTEVVLVCSFIAQGFDSFLAILAELVAVLSGLQKSGLQGVAPLEGFATVRGWSADQPGHPRADAASS